MCCFCYFPDCYFSFALMIDIFLLLASNYLKLIFPICFLNYFAAIPLHFPSMIQGDNSVLSVNPHFLFFNSFPTECV